MDLEWGVWWKDPALLVQLMQILGGCLQQHQNWWDSDGFLVQRRAFKESKLA